MHSMLKPYWYPIPNFRGYWACSDGRIYSYRSGKVLSPRGKPHLVCDAGERKSRCLHRLAYTAFYGSIPAGMLVDHINRDPADNRLCNLRLATRSQNNRNRGPGRRDTISRFKGVSRSPDRPRWIAHLRGDDNSFVSYHKTEVEAALAHDELARKHHGDFACLNFPERKLTE